MDTPSPGNPHEQLEGVKGKAKIGACAALLTLVICVGTGVGGCGAPGEPVPPSPPIPVAVMDLTAHQLGNGVMLEFALPVKSMAGERLKEIPTMEILRGFPNSDGTIDEKAFRVVDTIPGAMLADYVDKGKVHFLDPITPEEIRAHAGITTFYRVRARVSDRKTSAISNDASLKLFAVAEAIDTVGAHLTEQGIDLRWSAPVESTGGAAGEIAEYHVYRGEVDPAAAGKMAQDIPHAAWKSPLLQIAATKSAEYRDSAFDYGKTYVYVVRAVLSGEGSGVESSDSRTVTIKPVDTFPPAAPQGLVAAVIGQAAGGKIVVDLSWSINVEADLAGYRVYRSEQPGMLGEALNSELLATPSYRDATGASGGNYWYSVKALDRTGNESKASEQVAVENQ
jgi:hypothetical protein